MVQVKTEGINISSISLDGQIMANDLFLSYENEELTSTFNGTFKKTVGFNVNVNEDYYDPQPLVSIYAFTNYGNQPINIYGRRDDYTEVIFDVEHGVIYNNDTIIYTLTPEQKIYNKFVIRVG